MDTNTFIFDLITARGWSMRHLGELTGISYSGIRDYLRGLPQRLSQTRLSRVYELWDLDGQGRLKPHTMYAWQIKIQPENQDALGRVLLATIEQHSKPEASDDSDAPADKSAAAAPSTGQQFAATPLFGGDTEGLPAPYWVLCWNDIYLLIQWRLPPTRRTQKVPGFYAQEDSRRQDLLPVNPHIQSLDGMDWAPGMELSKNKARGIFLTPAQMSQLKKCEKSAPLKLETLQEWLQAEPSEDPFWFTLNDESEAANEDAAGAEAPFDENNPWTWKRVLESLQHRYGHPAFAAKQLGLK